VNEFKNITLSFEREPRREKSDLLYQNNKQKAIFLDRDGVINEDYGYVYKKEDFKFKEGIFEVLKSFQDKGYKLFIVTNQSGIARKFYSEDEFHNLMEWVKKEFAKKGIKITDYRFCPHHPEITGVCECRKPKAGMILDLAKKYNIDLKNSILIGDSKRDIETGQKARVGKNILVSKDENIFDIIKEKGYI
jgi:D-glycero-D-manno-heptose 1,7-bisphosphate phosphatase